MGPHTFNPGRINFPCGAHIPMTSSIGEIDAAFATLAR
jgi:hypothetical protein